MKTTPCTEDKPQSQPFYAFNLAQRCGAKTRSGQPCKSPAVRDKRRCRMHGGTKGSGAPRGNQNAFKHGYNTREIIEQRKEIRKILAEYRTIKTCIFD